jgi:hypothetical protein
MDIKIQCSCGNKYEFELEPVGGQAPASLCCPDCGASWTEYANACLAQAQTPPEESNLSVATEQKQSRAEEQSGAGDPGLSLRPVRPAPVRVAVPAALATPLTAPGVALPARKPSFARGVLGAALGAAVGGLVWFLIFLGGDTSTSLFGLGVGLLCGLGAHWLSRDEGSKELGMIAGVLTVLAILLTQYAVARSQTTRAVDRAVKEQYEQLVAQAQQVLKNLPTQSDEEIRQFLSSHRRPRSGGSGGAEVTADDIAAFRKQLPLLQNLASRQVTPAELAKLLRSDLGDFISRAASSTTLLQNIGLFGAAMIVTAAGIAYKINANA